MSLSRVIKDNARFWVPHDGGLSALPHVPTAFGPGGEPELNCMVALARHRFDAAAAILTLFDDLTPRVDAPAGVDACALAQETRSRFLEEDCIGTRTVGNTHLRPFADMPVILTEGAAPIGILSLFDIRPRVLSGEQSALLRGIAQTIATLLHGRRADETIGRLTADLGDMTRLLREEHDSVARYKKMYDRSATLARIGVWECDLKTNQLTWTDGVYDIFELPRGSAVTRDITLGFYYKNSREDMEAMRSKAIQECGSTGIEVRIRTAKGKRRWVRLTIDVECDDGLPARIFGLKQDVTEEKELWDRMRRLAECDPLTGLANRSVFQAALAASLDEHPNPHALAGLMLIDLDGFKAINDTFGHAAGDECLKQIGRRLARMFRRTGLVARIGGDEFAIVLRGARNRAKLTIAAQRIIDDVRQPILWEGQTLDIGASIGLVMPDASQVRTPSEIFTEADLALYAAKKAGRNTFRIFQPRHARRPDADEDAPPSRAIRAA